MRKVAITGFTVSAVIAVAARVCFSQQIQEKTLMATVMIQDRLGNVASGFLLKGQLKPSGNATFLVSNNHVLHPGLEYTVFLPAKTGAWQRVEITVNKDNYLPHPRAPQVDVAAVDLLAALKEPDQSRRDRLSADLEQRALSTAENFLGVARYQERGFGIGSECFLLGYPASIVDPKKTSYTMMVLRSVYVATEPSMDATSPSSFMIDGAVVPGASGGPVLIRTRGALAVTTQPLLENARIREGRCFFSGLACPPLVSSCP